MFNFKKHNSNLYSTLLHLSRNMYFYDQIKLNDTFENRLYLMIIHFSIILQIFKRKKIKFLQKEYDNLFFSIENESHLHNVSSMELTSGKVLRILFYRYKNCLKIFEIYIYFSSKSSRYN